MGLIYLKKYKCKIHPKGLPINRYKRSSNLLDALIGNKKVIFYRENFEDPFDRESHLEINRAAFKTLRERGILSSKKMGSLLGRYFSPSYMDAGKKDLMEFSLQEVCVLWKYIKIDIIRGLIWKSYYEEKGVTRSMFNRFRAEILHSDYGTAVAATLLEYKGKIFKKYGKGSNDNRRSK